MSPTLVAAFRDLPRQAHRLIELSIETRVIKEVLEADFGAGKVSVTPHYRGPNAGRIMIVIQASPSAEPQQLRDRAIALIRRVSPDLLHGPVGSPAISVK
jgi:hypothetical protein